MSTESELMSWCGLPAELHLSHAPVTPARVALRALDGDDRAGGSDD